MSNPVFDSQDLRHQWIALFVMVAFFAIAP
jgi:hypothetical protein